MLPNVTKCPACDDDSLHIYRDGVLGGEWFSCHNCNKHGDMIELAQAVWRTDLEGTILKLVARGCDLPVDGRLLAGYQKQHIDRRKEIWDFWKQSQKNLASDDSPEIAELMQKLNLQKYGQPLTWAARGGQFLGSVDCRAVDAVLSKGHAANRKADKHGSKAFQIFKGAKWEDVLVIPFSDLPGRISAFTFVGRRGDEAAGDHVFRSTYLAGDLTTVHDPGVTMLSTLLATPNSYLDDNVFAFSGPVIALKMQLRWLRDNANPLPIIGLYHNRTQQPRLVWRDMPARNYVFCAPRTDPHVLAQAVHAGGKVATNRLAQADLGGYFRKHSPMDLLKLMRRTAQPWRKVFQAAMMRKDIARAEALFLKMQLSGTQLASFGDDRVRERIELIQKRAQLHKTIVVRNQTIRETDEGWMIEPRPSRHRPSGNATPIPGERICNAVIRLINVIGTPSGRSYYRGIISFQGTDIPFFANTKDVDPDAMAWCDQFLKQNGHGTLTYNTEWAAAAVLIAKQFHPPQYVQGLEQVGWSPDQAVFAFPKFAISATGRPAENCEVLATGSATPAVNMQPPTDLDRSDILALSQSDESAKLFWLTAVSIIHNVLAPAMRFEPRGLALVGKGGQAVGNLAAKMLGCEALKSSLRIGSPSHLQASCDSHAWPALLTKAATRTVANWLTGEHSRNCIINTDWLTAKVLAARGPWAAAASDTPLCDLRQMLSAAGKLIPAYLQRLCRRRMRLPQGDTMLAICKDLGSWLDDENGDASVLEQVARELADQAASADTIGQILGRGIHSGAFEYVQKGCKIAKRVELYLVYDADEDTVWISQQVLNRWLSRKGAPTLDTKRVTELLGKTLIRQDLYSPGSTCWVLPAAWITEHVAKWDALGPNIRLAT